MVIMEIFFPPSSFQREGSVLNDRIGILKDVSERLHLSEFLQFSFTHNSVKTVATLLFTY